MTTREQLTTPVVAKIRSNGLVQPRVASEEALKVLRREPIATVWGRSNGLPIYDRLPEVSQAYKLEAGPDSAYVYLSPNFPKREGPGSLQPGRLNDDFSFFVMEDGEITWSYGQVNVPRLEVNVETLNNGAGLPDGQYKAGYLMSFAVPPSPEKAVVRQVDEVLSEAFIAYASDRDVVNHEDFRALSEDPEDSWWAQNNTGSGVYANGAWYVLDFQRPVHPETIKFVGQPGERATATLAVYSSDDAIIWDKEGEVKPVGETWTFQELANTDKHRYWRFFWWGGYVTVGSILYTGEALYEDARKSGPVSGALPFIDDLYEEIDDTHLLVATFTVQSGKVVSIVDQRRFIQRKYEPVAQWLTSYQDLMLRCYFEDVEQYAALYMAPTTADYHFYQELETNACSGQGFLSIGEQPQQPLILFPDIVSLEYSVAVNPAETYELPSFYVSQTLDFLDADIYEFDPSTGLPVAFGETLLANGIVTVPGPGKITPDMVDLVGEPILDSDLATKVWTDSTLQTGRDIDNGIY